MIMAADRDPVAPASASLAERWLRWLIRRPLAVCVLVLVMAALSVIAAGQRLGVHTNPADLLDRDLPFQTARARIAEAFPHLENSVLLVVEAASPEQARTTAQQVVERLRAMPETVRSVDWPAGEAFFLDHGLLLRSPEHLDALTDRLALAQPMLARLAESPTVPGLFNLLAEAGDAAADGSDPGLDLDPTLAAVADAIDASLDGRSAPLSWQRLVAGGGDDPAASTALATVARELLLVSPALDFKRVMAGRDAIEAVRALRAELGLDTGPVRLRITGSVALAYEELQSVVAGATLAGVLAVLLVTVMMYVGLRSVSLVAVAILSLLAGLALALGFATIAIGHLNLISIAFAVLYVGLGVNYAIHLLLRFREGLAAGLARAEAVVFAGDRLFGALALSAVTTAIGFFAFVPTDYAGVAELGLIAGVAMLISFAVSYTLIPAALMLAPLPGKLDRDRVPVLPARWLDVPLVHRRTVRWLALALALLAVSTAVSIRFDSDPLNLRDPDSESVATLRALLADRVTGHRNLQAVAADRAEAERIAAELEALPSVERVVALFDFAPADQDDKLAMIEDLRWLLGPELLSADWTAPASPADPVVQSVQRLADAPAMPGPGSARLADALARLGERLASADPGAAAGLSDALHDNLLGLLPTAMAPLTRALAVTAPVQLDAIPPTVSERWRSADGQRQWLMQIFPADDLSESDARDRFVAEVASVLPSVSGMPVIQLESGRAIVSAFREAMVLAVLGIAIVLVVVLRSLVDALRVLLPLLLGGAVTLASMVWLDLPFNFANVIALPLLLGVGVDNGIHLVLRHRAGALPGGNVLRSATARGIVFGALTTVASFGNLAFSPHVGTAGLGLVLAIGLSLIVLATLVVVPALLRRS